MLIAHLDPLAASLFSLLAIGSLLLSFVMLGSRWLKDYLLAFMAQSWLIAALSGAVAYYGQFPELYLIAILTALFRGLLLPWLVWRIIGRLAVSREVHLAIQPSSSLVLGAVRLRRIEPSGQRTRFRRHRCGIGADRHAVDEADWLPDACSPP